VGESLQLTKDQTCRERRPKKVKKAHMMVLGEREDFSDYNTQRDKVKSESEIQGGSQEAGSGERHKTRSCSPARNRGLKKGI